MLFYKLLAILLEYPTLETCAHYGELRETVDELALDETEKQVLRDFIDWCSQQRPTQLQAKYVETFDLTPDHCLYLTHHLYEEQDAERGATLATLKEFFRHQGFAVEGGELPDYLPLILEFVSQSDQAENLDVAKSLLEQSAPAMSEVATRMVAHDIAWAPLLKLLEQNLDPQRHATLAAA